MTIALTILITLAEPPPFCDDWVADPPTVDWNQDGGVDGADVEAFCIDWGDCQVNTDLNGNYLCDYCDLLVFLDFWAMGG